MGISGRSTGVCILSEVEMVRYTFNCLLYVATSETREHLKAPIETLQAFTHQPEAVGLAKLNEAFGALVASHRADYLDDRRTIAQGLASVTLAAIAIHKPYEKGTLSAVRAWTSHALRIAADSPALKKVFDITQLQLVFSVEHEEKEIENCF